MPNPIAPWVMTAGLLAELLLQPLSYREIRYTEVVAQTKEYTCGAAAVATLLAHLYGLPTSEHEILKLAAESMRARGEEPGPGHALTAYDLKKALDPTLTS